jgi:hypothetical protein
METIDLTKLPSGRTYENTYGQYMAVFKRVAEADEILVLNAPDEWCTLLYYLGATLSWDDVITDFRALGLDHFPTIWEDPETEIPAHLEVAVKLGRLRELVETFEGNRPELVDALYKSDCEWDTKGRRHQMQKEFVVTTNGSFQRPEVIAFMERLYDWRTSAENAVLVPCAADKPYPSPLHRKVKSGLQQATDRAWEVVVFTGTLGFCPEPLWGHMPHYDSGMPNQWRLQEATREWLVRQKYRNILVYGDFYNTALLNGLLLSGFVMMEQPAPLGPRLTHDDGREVCFVNEAIHYHEYLDLLDEARLKRLVHQGKVLTQGRSQASLFAAIPDTMPL